MATGSGVAELVLTVELESMGFLVVSRGAVTAELHVDIVVQLAIEVGGDPATGL